MKTLFTLLLFSLGSLSFGNENSACLPLLEELRVSPTPIDNQMRKITFAGTTAEGKNCRMHFLPDYCTFQLEAPLEKVEMYYLMDTDASSVKTKFKSGEKFSLKSVTKEDGAQLLELLTRTLSLEKKFEGYELKYRVKSGRVFKTDISNFTCIVKPVR